MKNAGKMLFCLGCFVFLQLQGGCDKRSESPPQSKANVSSADVQSESKATSVVTLNEQQNATLDPELGKLIKETFYNDADKLESVQISSAVEKEILLNNLVHLKNLKEIEFSSIPASTADLDQIGRFPNISELKFYQLTAPDLTQLSRLPALEIIRISKCNNVDWTGLSRVKCPKLRGIEIRSTEFSGNDFRSFANIESIRHLQLSDMSCDDSDLAEISSLSQVNSLSVFNCQNVTGEFLAKIPKLQLKEFEFAGPLTAEFAQNLTRFSDLELVQINSKELLPEAWFASLAENCKQLNQLTLSYQPMSRKKIESIGKLSRLKVLELYSGSKYAGFPGPRVKLETEPGDFAVLAKLNNLQTFRIVGPYKLNVNDGEAITAQKDLVELELSEVIYEEDGVFAGFGQLSQVRSLDISQSKRLREGDASKIGLLKNLEQLDLSEITTRGTDFSALRGLENLRMLNLSDCGTLTDDDMVFARGMGRLEELRMKGNSRITDKGIAELKHAKSLREFFATHLKIDGTGFSDWPADHQMNFMMIEGTPISQQGIEAISTLQNLSFLDIRAISFSGNFEVDVTCFKNTKSLESLSLLGHYWTTREKLEELTQARPELSVACRVK